LPILSNSLFLFYCLHYIRLSRRNIKNVILNDVYHIVPAVVPVYFPVIIARCDIKNIQSLYPKADAG